MTIRNHALAAAFFLAFAVHTSAASADEYANCFEVAVSKINRGSVITITKTDSAITTGRMEFLDAREKVLLLGSLRPTGEEARSYRLDEISRIEYRGSNSNSSWLAKGIVFGGVLGAGSFYLFSRSATANGHDKVDTITALGGTLIGSVVGIFVGPFIGTLTTTTRYIECPSTSMRHVQ